MAHGGVDGDGQLGEQRREKARGDSETKKPRQEEENGKFFFCISYPVLAALNELIVSS